MLFRVAFDHAAIGMAITAHDGRWLKVNRAFCELLGYSEQELLARTFQSVTHPDDLPHDERLNQRALAGEFDRYQIEKRYIHRRGHAVWIALNVVVVRDALDAPPYSLAQIQDISERKRAEMLLRDSESRHRQLVEQSPDGIIIHSDGRFRYLNPAVLALLGYDTPDELVGVSLLDVLPETEHAAARVRIAGTVLGRKPTREEVRVLRRDGTSIDVEIVTAAVTLAGEPVVQTVVRDITERKRVEAALRESEALLRDAQEIASVGSWAWDMVTGAVAWSDEYYRILGFSPGARSATYEHYLDAVHPEDRPRIEAESADAVRRVGTFAHDYRLVRPDGAVREIHCRGRVIADANGAARRMIGSLQDVTERNRAEAALRESEARFRAVFDQAGVGITILDDAGAFLHVNAAFERFTGHTAAELRGRIAADLSPADDRVITREPVRDLKAGRVETVAVEKRFVHRDGTLRWATLTLTQVTLADGQRALVGLVEDLTQRKALEAQLRQSQKLEAVGQLAGGVAHDFNNILAAILGYGELLKGAIAAGDPRRADVEEILKGAHRAAALTGQLLAFSRKQLLQPSALELNEVVAETTALLRPLLGSALHLVTLPAPTPVPVHVDRTQLEQVLMNLAINARDAMPDGGTLTIEVGVAPSTGTASSATRDVPSVATLVVHDTGVGMSPEVAARVFEPFFTTKELGRGTGLGLATVHGIVKQSGGTIRVDSRPNAGTTFTITLPLAESIAPPAPAPSAPDGAAAAPTPDGRKTVLVVEDEGTVRAIARRVLERAGFRVLGARHGADALRLLARYGAEVDVLLSDVVMPEVGGFELAARAVERVPGLRVVLMSGYTDADLGHVGDAGAVDAFLQKPFTVDGLLAAVRGAASAGQRSR